MSETNNFEVPNEIISNKPTETEITKLENKIWSFIIWEFKAFNEKLSDLYKYKSLLSLEELKVELPKLVNLKEWNSYENYEKLAEYVLSLTKLKEESKKWIESLKAEISKELLNEIFWDSVKNEDLLIWKYSKETLERLNNPKNFRDQMLWAWIWISESLAQTLKIVYDLLKWWLKLPLDLIKIIKWEAKYDWFKDI